LLGKELLEVLGASALVIVTLSVFWKADDAISDEFRSDVSNWLLRLSPPPKNSPVGTLVHRLFERVFGEQHWTFRCFSVSALVSFASFASIVLLSVAVSHDFKLHDLKLSRAYELPLVLSMVFVLNPVVDYVSLFCTRVVLRLMATNRLDLWSALSIDTVASLLAFFLVASLFFQTALYFSVFEYLAMLTDSLMSPSKPGLFDHVANLTTDELNGSILTVTNVFLYAVLFSAFVSSIWLWAAVVGTLLIRLLAESGSLMDKFRYILPVKQKPVRAIGITAFLFVFLVLLALNVAMGVLGVISN